MTRYVYDSLNFRLLRMKTEGYTLDLMPPAGEMIYDYNSGSTKQDFAYTYDALGNIISINDATPDAGIGGIGDLERDFNYDALYRLLQATGRENGPATSNPYDDDIRSDSVGTTRGYTQQYQFDAMGNILNLNHYTSSGAGNFTRKFNGGSSYGSTNLLNEIKIGSDTFDFYYDSCGNQITQTIDRSMYWDFADRMFCFCNQTGTAEPSQYAQYCYDATGQRVMKVVRTGGGAYKVSIYIGNIFEEYYEYTSVGGTFLGYQDEIMIMDNQSKIASNLIGTSYSDPYMGVKYIYPDHLGSSNVSCSGTGAFLTREEYYPFGETSFGSYGKKRYRFCGKERDDESGMYYYGARYYLSWTCRFVSVDPLAEKFPYYTSYQYAGNKPINFIDLDGMEEGKPNDGANSTNLNAGGSSGDKNTPKEGDIRTDPKGGNWIYDNKGWSVLGPEVVVTGTNGIIPGPWAQGSEQYNHNFEVQHHLPAGFSQKAKSFGEKASKVLSTRSSKSEIDSISKPIFPALINDGPIHPTFIEFEIILAVLTLGSGNAVKLATEKTIAEIGEKEVVGTATKEIVGSAAKKTIGVATKETVISSIAEIDETALSNEIIAINKTTEGGGELLTGSPSSIINSASYYTTTAEQSSSIFRSIIGNHLFVDGNKRTAILVAKSLANRFGLNLANDALLEKVALDVAKGDLNDVATISKLIFK